MLHGTLAALASELKPVVLVNTRGALGLDAEVANEAQLEGSWASPRRVAPGCNKVIRDCGFARYRLLIVGEIRTITLRWLWCEQ